MPNTRTVHWIFYPKSHSAPDVLRKVVEVFTYHHTAIDSESMNLSSNEVLKIIEKSLTAIGFSVESVESKLSVPVLFGKDGLVEKSFHVDAHSPKMKVVLEVEAGRAVDNNQFLKDLFEACMMQDVDFLIIALRKIYRNKPDFDIVSHFFDALYSSQRIILPLKGVMIIGY